MLADQTTILPSVSITIRQPYGFVTDVAHRHFQLFLIDPLITSPR
jgi:hypothetical protein